MRSGKRLKWFICTHIHTHTLTYILLRAHRHRSSPELRHAKRQAFEMVRRCLLAVVDTGGDAAAAFGGR
jgi:hypothetical protein